MRVTQVALEEYFRLRLGQAFDFANDLSYLGVDMSIENPQHEAIFAKHLNNRDWIENTMKTVFHTIWPPYGSPEAKTEDMMIAECLWDAIRFARGRSRWNQPFQIGSEPVPKIEKEE